MERKVIFKILDFAFTMAENYDWAQRGKGTARADFLNMIRRAIDATRDEDWVSFKKWYDEHYEDSFFVKNENSTVAKYMRCRTMHPRKPGRKADTRSLLEIFTENGKRNGKTKEQAEEYYQLFAESIGEGIDAQQQAKHVVRCIKYGYLPEQRPPYKKIREELPGFKESAKRFVSEQLKK